MKEIVIEDSEEEELEQLEKYEMISGNVINATESMICAYPSLNIKFENHTSLKVYFQDEIKNTKWELYNLN